MNLWDWERLMRRFSQALGLRRRPEVGDDDAIAFQERQRETATRLRRQLIERVEARDERHRDTIMSDLEVLRRGAVRLQESERERERERGRD